MRRTTPDIVLWALQLRDRPRLPFPELNPPTNSDLIGGSCRCQDSVITVVATDPERPDRYVIVQDLITGKSWSVPAGVIRLALGETRRRRSAA
jgi:hypothetical protein